MKISFVFIISLLLTTAILAPSVIILMELNTDMAILMDCNEEEEKKEIGEKDFFFYSWSNAMASSENTYYNFNRIYIKGNYTTTLDIFLPPPKYIC